MRNLEGRQTLWLNIQMQNFFFLTKTILPQFCERQNITDASSCEVFNS